MPRRRVPAVDPHLAVLYITSRGAEDIEVVEEELRRWWCGSGADLGVVDVVHEEDSAEMPLQDREGFRAALLGLVDHGAGVLVARCAGDLGIEVDLALAMALVRMQGASLELAEDPAWTSRAVSTTAGDLVEMLISFEGAARGARLRFGLEQRRRHGKHTGGAVPYGFKVDAGGDLVEDSREQIAVERMVQMRRDGLSYGAIAEALTAEGFTLRSGREGVAPSRDSGRWHPKTVAALIHRALASRGHER